MAFAHKEWAAQLSKFLPFKNRTSEDIPLLDHIAVSKLVQTSYSGSESTLIGLHFW